MQGLTCDIVSTGMEAVNAASQKDYDIIFMDCQMPELDGFETTKKIRALEGKKKNVIIIAMTAYAMKDDQVKCLEAGMNDYLSKPIDMKQLFQLISKYCNKLGLAQHKELPMDYYEKIIHALMKESGFDREISVELLKELQLLVYDLLKKIGQFIEEGNLQEASIYIHQLKGSAGNLRARDIAEYALALENELAGNKDLSYIRELLTKMQLLADKLQKEKE